MAEKVGGYEEIIGKRYFDLGKIALRRYSLEVDGETDRSQYDMRWEADKLQLENPHGKERWELVVPRSSTEVILRQLYWSDAGGIWQRGLSFSFDLEVVRGVISPGESIVSVSEDSCVLRDDRYFEGLSRILSDWPVAKWFVTPLEDEV